MTQQVEVGLVLRGGTAEFIVGCRVNQLAWASFGALVRAPLASDYVVYGLIREIRIDDDGLVRQLATAENVSDEVVLDNRERRIVPVEMTVVVVGYEHDGRIHHQLPPRPPVSLDVVYLCNRTELQRFTSSGRFGYFRHLLRLQDSPLGDLLAAHVSQARLAQDQPARWAGAAMQEVIELLRDDYPLLTSVLGSLDSLLAENGDEVDI